MKTSKNSLVCKLLFIALVCGHGWVVAEEVKKGDALEAKPQATPATPAAKSPAPAPKQPGAKVPAGLTPPADMGISTAGLNVAIDSVTPLPVGPMVAIKSGDKVYFASANGRYVFQGPLVDLWTGKRYSTPNDDFSGLKDIPQDTLARFMPSMSVISNPALSTDANTYDGVAFVDPNCPYCVQAFKLVAEAGINLKWIIVPYLGQKSQTDVVALWCSDDPVKSYDFLVNHKDPTTLAQNPECDKSAIQKSLITAQVLGVNGVPFFIRSDGSSRAGFTPDYISWIKGGKNVN